MHFPVESRVTDTALTLGRKSDGSPPLTEATMVTGCGAVTVKALASVELPPADVTVALRAPSAAVPLTLTLAIVIVVPSGETTTELGVNVMSPAAPLNVTVALLANLDPFSVRVGRTVPRAALLGKTLESSGLVTAKGSGLPTWPFTATVTGPSIAFAGTVTVNCVVVAPGMTVADTRAPLTPAKVTESAVSVVLKPVPMSCTLLPSSAAGGFSVDSVGAAGGVLD